MGEDTPLSECLLGIYQDHYARDGRAAEHLCIELDERDLDDWIDRARALEAEVARLRAVEAAARTVLETWDRELPAGVGIVFFSSLIDLRTALGG
jgi:hypothetical protein